MNIFQQGHLPTVPVYFFGGPLDETTRPVIRDKVFEGRAFTLLNTLYEVQWNNLRWEAYPVDKGAIGKDNQGRPVVVPEAVEEFESKVTEEQIGKDNFTIDDNDVVRKNRPEAKFPPLGGENSLIERKKGLILRKDLT